MRPILFHLPEWMGGHPIPTYGIVLGLGCVVGALVWTYLAARAGRPALRAFEIALTVMVVAILSSKVVGLLFQPPSTLSLWEKLATTGGVWYVGFLAGVAAATIGVRRLGFTAWQGLDRAAASVAVGHGIGRLGCLFAGCCFGTRCEQAWGITFQDELAHRATRVPLGEPLHPTAVYESLGELSLAAILLWLLLSGRSAFDGHASALYLIGYAVLRFIVEFFRGDQRGMVGPLSTSQAIGVVLFLAGTALLAVGLRRRTLAFRAAAGKGEG